jgi:hypothetical protein
MTILINKNVFDDYFNLLYKLEYDQLNSSHHWSEQDCEQETNSDNTETDTKLPNNSLLADYEKMDQIIQLLKDTIKSKFKSAIENKQQIPINGKKYHKLIYCRIGDAYSDTISYESEWIKTNNKITLYNYLLFGSDKSDETKETDKTDRYVNVAKDYRVMSNCIDYWFSNGFGYYDENNRINTHCLLIDQMTNINLIDSIGQRLKQFVRMDLAYNMDKIANTETNLNTETDSDIPTYEQIRDSIYDYKSNTKDINYVKYESFLDNKVSNVKFGIFNPDLPKLYTDTDTNANTNLDLIELFDVFFGIEDGSSIYSNYKKYSGVWIESTDELFIDLDA